MGTYMSMAGTLIMPDSLDVKKAICKSINGTDTLYDLLRDHNVKTTKELCEKTNTTTLLSYIFQSVTPDTKINPEESMSYKVDYNDDCSYSWAESVENLFAELAPYLENESEITMENADEHDYTGIAIKDHELVYAYRHDFYTHGVNFPSDDDIVQAITHAADILKESSEKKNGIAENLAKCESLTEMLNILKFNT